MAATVSSSSSLYDVLGIQMGASGHEIKAAYRRLARTCHPDVVSMKQKEMSENEFKKIHAAYSTLSDPDQRASYDRDLYGRSRRTPIRFSSLSSAAMASMSSSRFKSASATTTSSSSYANYSTSRNWETDQCW